MGWGSCGKDSKGRPIGYNHAATCDHKGCKAKIDRGLSYACGGMHGAGGNYSDAACEGYFCSKHIICVEDKEGNCFSVCQSCYEEFKDEWRNE